MRSKSSKGGKGSATHLHIVPSQTSNQPAIATTTKGRGWQKNTGLTLKTGPTPEEVWTDSQLRSILGITYSEEMKTEWLAKYDIHTRRPRAEQGPAPSRFARALRAAWRAGATFLMGFGISACAQELPDKQPIRFDTPEGSFYRMFDPEFGVMCYSYLVNGPYDCVQVREGYHGNQ